jgi:membrane associated rhomboid family serine protease
MNLAPSNRITPWVLRLIIANAVVLLLMRTVLTSPDLAAALAFDPASALRHWWTFLSYMFVHAGLLHLLGNMLMLFVFGTAVESRMGSRAFLLYYLFCGTGAAVFALGLSSFMAVSPFIGASGAVLGVALAVLIRARTLVTILIGIDVFFSFLMPSDGIAHLAHVGGAGFGYLFFRLQGMSRRTPHPPPRAVERVVMVQSGPAEPERRTPVTPVRQRRRADADPVAAEVDRVLDKISEKGIGSLTPAERRFLDEVSKQKKQEN